MKRRTWILFLILTVCLVLSSCSLPFENSGNTEPDKQSEQGILQPSAKEKIFVSEDRLFCLTADESWEEAKNFLDIQDASLSLSKGSRNYIVLISEYKYNFSSEAGLEGYNRLVIKNMERNVDEDEAGEVERIRLGDYDACRTVLTGKVEEQAMSYTIYCAEIEDYYVQLICWTTEEDVQAAEAAFDQIAQTLSVPEETETEEEVY